MNSQTERQMWHPDRRDFFKLAGAAILAGSLFPLIHPLIASATTWSGNLTKTIDGITYTYKSGIDGGARPKATTNIIASTSVPAGRIEARALLVKGLSGNILASSSWKANAAGKSVSASVTYSSAALGARSRGEVRIGGERYRCNATSALSMHDPNLAKNAQGKTYGSYYHVEQGLTPDLLAVVADNGLEGYVLYEQFVDENAPDQIPVYDVEGVTVIGTFTFGDK